jgi:acetyltransferase-like isoleucine patch superfamily enzyme
LTGVVGRGKLPYIGTEFTIAAGAVITGDIPDYVLAPGDPAIIKERGINVG